MALQAYLRVSTEQQTESGAGLDGQLAACERYAEGQGQELAGTYFDRGVSGGKGLDARPGLLDAIAALGKGDELLVAKRDRLGRDPMVVAMIEAAVQRKGARIVSASGEGTEADEPTNILMRRMVDAFAEYERLVIGARTKAALAARKSQGRRTGSVPYGYRADAEGYLHEHAGEQAVIAEARRLKAAGLSLRAIAGELERKGFYTRTGKQFNPNQVKRILDAAA